jgi:hypothetical protein
MYLPSVVGGAAAAMAAINKVMDPVETQKTLSAFTREMEKVNLAEEAWGDMVDVFDGDGLEEESEAVYNQVLDELGIEVGHSLQAAPSSSRPFMNKDALDDEVFWSIFTPF